MKMAKLNPDNIKSAKDVMDERAAAALKRKRAEEGGDGLQPGPSEVSEPGLDAVHPRLKKPRTKTRMMAGEEAVQRGAGNETSEQERRANKAEQKAANKARKIAKIAKAKKEHEMQKACEGDAVLNEPVSQTAQDPTGRNNPGGEGEEGMVEGMPVLRGSHTASASASSTAPPSPIGTPLQSPNIRSASSSTSSVQALSASPSSPRKKFSASEQADVKPPPALTPSTLTPKERLEARLLELRVQRKADGPDGRPARNRQELLEARRRKEEERRAHKKELRRRAREEEARKQEEEIEKRFSPGGLGSILASQKSPLEPSNNFSFSRVAFDDGTQADANLTSLLEQRKRKGPADPATALKAAQSKMSRLSGLHEEKRADIEEKDMWLNAKKRANGERVRDDTSLLKKALKRQEGTKKKSEKEWNNRIGGVAKSQEIRQKKREENIRKRKEDKGKKSGKAKSQKVRRPGFEGNFRGRTGPKKK